MGWNGSQHRKEQGHDQRYKQHQCRHHERPEFRGSDQSQEHPMGATLCKDRTCSVEIRIMIVQVFCHHHPPLWLWDTNPACWLKKKKTEAFEIKCLRKLLRIPYFEHKTNDWVWSKISFLVGPREPLPATVKRRRLAWFDQATRYDSLSKPFFRAP